MKTFTQSGLYMHQGKKKYFSFLLIFLDATSEEKLHVTKLFTFMASMQGLMLSKALRTQQEKEDDELSKHQYKATEQTLWNKRKPKLLEPDRRHTACPSGPPAHMARPPRLSGRDTRARTYSSGLLGLLGQHSPQKASLIGGCTLNLINHAFSLSPDNV
jgi:hypothetical protein